MKNDVFCIRFQLGQRLEKKHNYKNILWILCYPSYSEIVIWFREVVMCSPLAALQNLQEYLSGMRCTTLSHGLRREQMTFQPPFL